MIEISLIKDRNNYKKDRLDEMEKIVAKNFILQHDEELESQYKPISPEIRIYFKFTKGVIPEVILRAIGQDITKTISNNNFLNSFLNTNSNENPSLIFHFVGDFRSYEFRIKSTNEDEIRNGSKKVVEEILKIIKAEKLPPESHDYRSFMYENQVWNEIK